MSEMRLVGVAVWREVYSRRKAFLISTGLLLALVVGSLYAASVALRDDGPPEINVGVVAEEATELEAELTRRLAPDARFQLVLYASRAAGEDELRDGRLVALITGSRSVLWGPSTSGFVVDEVSGGMRSVYLRQVSDDLALEPADVTRLLAPIQGRSIDIEERDEATEVLSVVSVILMFVAIIAYGQWVAYGVVEEKANRVAELILGAISPRQLLVAKLVALGGLGFLQMALVTGAAVVTASALGTIDIPDVTISAVAWLLLWFLLGYAFYGSLYAASGSLAADTQEAGSFIGPLNIIPGLGYMFGVIAFSAGGTTVANVLSWTPFWAPLLMPGRMARGWLAGWEIALAVGLMVGATFLMMRLAARVYLGGMTQATRSVSWRQAFTGGRDFRAPGRA